jgi:hypothetical protein
MQGAKKSSYHFRVSSWTTWGDADLLNIGGFLPCDPISEEDQAKVAHFFFHVQGLYKLT